MFAACDRVSIYTQKRQNAGRCGLYSLPIKINVIDQALIRRSKRLQD